MVELGLSVSVLETLPPECIARLGRLADWDLKPASARAQRRLGWSTTHRRNVEREYRRFIALVAIGPDKAYGMAGDCDQFWHEHILLTEDYAAMCREVVGGMVHHRPNINPRRRRKRILPTLYDTHTRPALRRLYGEPLSDVWPKSSDDEGVAKCCAIVELLPGVKTMNLEPHATATL